MPSMDKPAGPYGEEHKALADFKKIVLNDFRSCSQNADGWQKSI